MWLRRIVFILLFAGNAIAQSADAKQSIELARYGFNSSSSNNVPTFIFITNDQLAVNLPTSPAKIIFYNLKSGTAVERDNSSDIAPFLPTQDGRFIRFISHSIVLSDAEMHEIARMDAPFIQRFGGRSVRVSPGGKVIAIPRDRDIMLLNAANFEVIDLLPASDLLSVGDNAALISPSNVNQKILLRLFGEEPVELFGESRLCQQKAEFLDDDHILISPCGSKKRRVADLAGRTVYSLNGTDALAFIQPSRDGKRFALEMRSRSKGKAITGSIRHEALPFDKVIHRVYDTATGKIQVEIELKQECGACMMFPYSALSPDGKHIAILDGTKITIYDVP